MEKRQLSRELVREKALRGQLERAHSELERMQKIKDTFGLFVTPEIVNHVLALPQETWKKGTRKTVTILFADVRRFTTFAENLPPETVVDFLNEIFSRMMGPIQRQGGILNKFLGDGILALFGAPIDMEGHAGAAARAALEARDAVEELAGVKQSKNLPPLHVGFGINTGEVIAGCLGTENRTEYSVIGNAVNLAARLEGAAEPGQILLGLETEKSLDGTFQRRKVGPLSLRGLKEPILVSELIGAIVPSNATLPAAIHPLKTKP
jgi:class 3 adenylate cyclase